MTERPDLIFKSTGILETLQVLLRGRSHTMSGGFGTTRSSTLVQGPEVLCILLTVDTDQALVVGDVRSQGVQVVAESVAAESRLQLVETQVGAGLDVFEHVDLELIKVLLLIGLLHELPRLFHVAFLDVGLVVELPGVVALSSDMTFNTQLSTKC